MKVWYIHKLSPEAHERNNYRWRAVKESWSKKKDDFRLYNFYHPKDLKKLERGGHNADITFVCDFECAEMVLKSKIARRRMGVVAHITGAGWRRTEWVNRALKRTAELKPDLVFLSHRVHLDKFREIVPLTHYVGLAFAPDVFWPTRDFFPRKWGGEVRDIVFCGNYQAMGRLRRLELMQAKLPGKIVDWRSGMSHDGMGRYLRSGKIGWNQIGKGPKDGVSCNLRVWEVLGSGILLLCNESIHVSDILKDGVHYVAWNNDADMLDKARHYLSHDKERVRIAKAGYKLALAEHTWTHRAREYKRHLARFIKGRRR